MAKKENLVSIRFTDEIFQRLSESAERMGISRTNYITYALKNQFQQEDIMTQLPEMMTVLKDIKEKIDNEERKGQ